MSSNFPNEIQQKENEMKKKKTTEKTHELMENEHTIWTVASARNRSNTDHWNTL